MPIEDLDATELPEVPLDEEEDDFEEDTLDDEEDADDELDDEGNVEASKKIKGSISRLPSGRWKDTNGNSYDSKEEAAEAEAHGMVDPKLDEDSPEYKEQHAEALKEILVLLSLRALGLLRMELLLVISIH